MRAGNTFFGSRRNRDSPDVLPPERLAGCARLPRFHRGWRRLLLSPDQRCHAPSLRRKSGATCAPHYTRASPLQFSGRLAWDTSCHDCHSERSEESRIVFDGPITTIPEMFRFAQPDTRLVTRLFRNVSLISTLQPQ